MKDMNGQVTGGNLPAADFNEIASEVQNVIEDAGITLSTSFTNQLAEAIAHYSAISTFYTGGGAANAQTLTPIPSLEAPPAYVDGMRVHWRPSLANTAATTIDVDSLGAKALVTEAGVALVGAELATTADAEARYDGTSFRLIGA